ncbi:recombinase family protein [Halobacillus sp. A1]|uniref:recombinase family protein n=1 Tax=Halobacillus sp. A1 TaxID=2880262 RepID=UPI0020A67D67|nr:recombinase family protein [Halobacillus sp. A1]
MKFGYARVSDVSQSLETQIEKLKGYGVDEIIMEKVSGVSEDKKLNELLSSMRKGDSLVVSRMDRLGRTARQLLQLVEDLEEKEVNLVFLDLQVDLNSPVGKFFLTNLAGFAELERSQLKEKQRAGIEIAKEKGVYKGRVTWYTQDHPRIQHAFELYDAKNHTVREICKICNLSKATFYRKLKERESNG